MCWGVGDRNVSYNPARDMVTQGKNCHLVEGPYHLSSGQVRVPYTDIWSIWVSGFQISTVPGSQAPLHLDIPTSEDALPVWNSCCTWNQCEQIQM